MLPACPPGFCTHPLSSLVGLPSLKGTSQGAPHKADCPQRTATRLVTTGGPGSRYRLAVMARGSLSRCSSSFSQVRTMA